MTHKIKMVGLDLDGTLLTDKKELTKRTRNVLEEGNPGKGLLCLWRQDVRGWAYRKN